MGRCISPLPPAPKNAPPALPAAPTTPTTNYERLHSKVAKVNKLQKIDSNENNEGNLSPRSWFRKNKKDMTMPNNGLSKSKSSSNNAARPISLLASISDFDRQAAQIVEQRLKDEEKRRRVNDESFYVKNSSNDGHISGSAANPKDREPQEA